MMSGLSSVLLAFRRPLHASRPRSSPSRSCSTSPTASSRRLIGATSPFGLQLDSLADLISFGLAPAILVHTWALDDWPVLSWLAAFFWLACAAFRLARFNVTIDPLADKRYFVGPALARRRRASSWRRSWPWTRRTSARAPARGWPGSRSLVSVVPGAAHGHDGALPLVPRPALAADPHRPHHDRGRRHRHRRSASLLAPGLTGLVVAYGYVLTAPLGVLTAPLRRAAGSGRMPSRRPAAGCRRSSSRSTRTTEIDRGTDDEADRRGRAADRGARARSQG